MQKSISQLSINQLNKEGKWNSHGYLNNITELQCIIKIEPTKIYDIIINHKANIRLSQFSTLHPLDPVGAHKTPSEPPAAFKMPSACGKTHNLSLFSQIHWNGS